MSPATVIGVAEDLGHAVDALLPNALRCSDHGDRVTVCPQCDDRAVVLQVVDTGMGMTAEELARVIEGSNRGGLSMAADTAGSHGGSLRAESVLGEGSCFTVVLPPAPRLSDLQSVGEWI